MWAVFLFYAEKMIFVAPYWNSKSVIQLQNITHVTVLMNAVYSMEFHRQIPQTINEVQQSPSEINSKDQRLFTISEEVY